MEEYRSEKDLESNSKSVVINFILSVITLNISELNKCRDWQNGWKTCLNCMLSVHTL